MKILIREEQLKLIEQIQNANPNLFITPNNWKKVDKSFDYKNKPFTLYYNNINGEFYLNEIGTKNTRQLPKSEYRDVGSALKPFGTNYLYVLKRNFEKTNKLNGDYQEVKKDKVYDKNPYEKNPNAPKTNYPVKPNPVSAVKPNQVGAVKRNPEEQRWVGIWEKFLVKYVGFKGGDKDNLTSDIDKKVYDFINTNRHLYKKNTNIKLGNLKKLMTDGKKGKVHDSFLPPYYYDTDTFPIYFYQKSKIIKEIQKKLGVKQTGIFLTQTESAVIKNSKKYNITYDRNTGITKDIYDAIMLENNNKIPYSNSSQTSIATKNLSKLEPSATTSTTEPISNKIK
jgi:hypothetical protein